MICLLLTRSAEDLKEGKPKFISASAARLSSAVELFTRKRHRPNEELARGTEFWNLHLQRSPLKKETEERAHRFASPLHLATPTTGGSELPGIFTSALDLEDGRESYRTFDIDGNGVYVMARHPVILAVGMVVEHL